MEVYFEVVWDELNELILLVIFEEGYVVFVVCVEVERIVFSFVKLGGCLLVYVFVIGCVFLVV